MKISLLPAALLTLSLSAGAAPQMCFDQAGKDYQIDPLLLMSISIKESHLVPDAINGSNRNGTEDVCGMQVNSSHYGKLKNFNITRERLLNDPCICVYTGAWVLAHNFRSYGKNWDSVGMYNTGPSKKLITQRKAYAQDIKNIYRVLLARKKLLSERLAPAAGKEHEIKTTETASLNSGQ
ncbi:MULTISPECIES: lytic transglycosylase domain-containing protein [Enterobacter]|jgi:soluble lytic murein transglycosylase-like protein|uniref:lytic transglycosylase domain-containing protein n=1 Tax=Enterobacter TaxID=547 RepID=UPI0007B3E840|nr:MULTISPECIES: lytic transglycosylase domain-containing protein [Enterobacter]KZP71670.1 lytic transglycosylase [Enterobacter hormaechei subsp. xiangfangensis]MDV0368311.1 lytic transglycosylase domain-containing protein [Enterobacter chengduensis]MDZ5641583.1 lytic transglycosylase domain-containing protein [Enterobacter sp. A103]MEB6622752.1 lytic transglycosylase domain-containing protein [Enterobacter roggenkampii]UNG07551.1 lytic transglycosylase domain-containing protein [Enterobacter 